MPTRARRCLELLAVAVAVAAPVEAGATKLAAVVRGAGAGSDKAAGYVSHFVRYYLAEDGRYEVIDNGDKLGGDGTEAARAFTEAADLVRKAMSSYETLDLDPAVDYLGTALKGYDKNAASLTDTRPVAEALMLLGAVHILRGEEKAGSERLTQAVAIYPAVEADPRIFNPSMRQVFQKAADQAARKPRGTINVTSSPSYAELYVDGVFRGVTPMAADQLTPGKHYVRLVRDGYKSYGNVVTVQPGREVAENGVLRPVKQLDAYEKAVAASLDELRSADPASEEMKGDGFANLETLLGVEHLFLVEVRLDAEHVKVVAGQYDLKAHRHLKTATHSFGYDVKPEIFAREISDLLRTQFGETTLARRAGSGAADTAVALGTSAGGSGGCFGMSCDRFKTVSLFGAGGGVVLGGAGALMYVLAKRDHDSYRKAVQGSTQAKSLESSGKTKALVGDVLVGVGAAAAVLGLGAYFFYQPPAGSVVGAEPPPPAVSVAAVPLEGGGAVIAGLRF